jgi:hypothetical protein
MKGKKLADKTLVLVAYGFNERLSKRTSVKSDATSNRVENGQSVVIS